MTGEKLRGAVVGCRGMGLHHARSISASEEVALAAICDLDEALAREAAASFPGAAVYADFERLLAEVQPQIVALAVPNTAHAALTIRAAEAGVPGICCEKPMALDLSSARAMLDACRRHGAQLIINHQRRTYPALVRMRELILSGAVGEVYLLRGSCAGDLLTDGTHLVDSLLHLAGDEPVRWAFGGIYRLPPSPDAPRGMGFTASGGFRYGHPVETGAMGTWEFRSGLRAEILCGGLRLPGRAYNDYEVLGTRGRIWRPGDQDEPGLYLQAGTPEWQPVATDPDGARQAISRNYDLLARSVRSGGGEHPLSGENALRGLEVLMGLYESARLRARVELPLAQDRFPLELMLAEGLL